MTLSRDHVRALARQAAVLVDPGLDHAVNDSSWFGAELGDGFTVSVGVGDGGESVWIGTSYSPAEALAAILDGIDQLSESAGLWGRPVPPCPGHPHPARVQALDGVVEFRCPVSGAVVERLQPVGERAATRVSGRSRSRATRARRSPGSGRDR